MMPRSLGRLISITSTRCALLSVPVSTNRKTHPIHDPPAGNDPTGHIASVPIPPISGHCRRTSIAGLLPLAFSWQTLWRPLCWSVIFGLGASMPMTLVAILALYRLTSRAPGGPSEAAGESIGFGQEVSSLCRKQPTVPTADWRFR
jgi:hypothetical protein